MPPADRPPSIPPTDQSDDSGVRGLALCHSGRFPFFEWHFPGTAVRSVLAAVDPQDRGFREDRDREWFAEFREKIEDGADYEVKSDRGLAASRTKRSSITEVMHSAGTWLRGPGRGHSPSTSG